MTYTINKNTIGKVIKKLNNNVVVITSYGHSVTVSYPRDGRSNYLICLDAYEILKRKIRGLK